VSVGAKSIYQEFRLHTATSSRVGLTLWRDIPELVFFTNYAEIQEMAKTFAQENRRIAFRFAGRSVGDFLDDLVPGCWFTEHPSHPRSIGSLRQQERNLRLLVVV
jgi:hypothetical protein